MLTASSMETAPFTSLSRVRMLTVRASLSCWPTTRMKLYWASCPSRT
jgi:hypothetical protein